VRGLAHLVAAKHAAASGDFRAADESLNEALSTLADDPLTCPEDALKDIAVDATLVDGRMVHMRLPEDDPAPFDDAAAAAGAIR